MAHTPGPWAVHLFADTGLGDPPHFAIFTDDGHGNGDHIPCGERDDDGHLEIAKANARLIEAAPAMLTALKAAKTWIYNDDVDRMGPAETSRWDALLDKIEAAIVTAERDRTKATL